MCECCFPSYPLPSVFQLSLSLLLPLSVPISHPLLPPLLLPHICTCAQRVPFAGDNFVRFTGDVKHFSQQQCKPWCVHLHATHTLSQICILSYLIICSLTHSPIHSCNIRGNNTFIQLPKVTDRASCLCCLMFCAVFAWEAYEHGTDLHPNVDPTKLELMYKEFKDKKENFKSDQQKSILEKVCTCVCVRACVHVMGKETPTESSMDDSRNLRDHKCAWPLHCVIHHNSNGLSPHFPSSTLQYGGEEHLGAPPKELLLAQTEHYVEYSRSGAVVKGQERSRVKSRYEEDVYINNHTVGVSSIAITYRMLAYTTSLTTS